MDAESEELRKRFEDATLARKGVEKSRASQKPASFSRAKLKRLLAAGGKIVDVRLKSRSLVPADGNGMSQKEITREQVAAIAANNLMWHKEVSGYQIRSVLRLEEIRARHPNVYGLSPEDLKTSWIAYLHDPSFFGLRSSTIIVISRATGRVIYLGSACDEG